LVEVDRLHGIGPKGGLCAPWSSLRDHVGLREAPWFQAPKELEACREREDWLRAAQSTKVLPLAPLWRCFNPIGAAEVDEAIVQVTGRLSSRRKNRLLRSASLWRAGWSIGEITQVQGIGSAAVRSAICRCDPTLLLGVLTHLQDERLLRSVQAVDGPQAPC
jgi:hypothetical protein